MNSIYLYDGPFERGEKGYPFIREAAFRHCAECGYDYDVLQAEICREEKGKPYFVDIPLEFSLSHSGLLWMCMFSDKPCGLDLQEIKKCDFEKIAQRNFTPEEQSYVRFNGIDGFFDLWVRKEAFCKHTGQGFFSEMPSVADKEMNLLTQIEYKGKNYYFMDIPISDELRCAVCTGEKTEAEMRILG